MSLMGLFSAVQSQSNGIAPPTLQEKTNWFEGTGNVDNTATARRNIEVLISAQVGVDVSEILPSTLLVDDLGMDDLDASELGTTFGTGFPKIDFSTYTILNTGLSDWYQWLSTYMGGLTVIDICEVWADAENRGKVLIA